MIRSLRRTEHGTSSSDHIVYVVLRRSSIQVVRVDAGGGLPTRTAMQSKKPLGDRAYCYR